MTDCQRTMRTALSVSATLAEPVMLMKLLSRWMAEMEAREPASLTVLVVLEIDVADEGDVAADDDHVDEVGHHRDVHEGQQADHDLGLGQGGEAVEDVDELLDALPRIGAGRDDEGGVDGRLDPAAGEDDAFEDALELGEEGGLGEGHGGGGCLGKEERKGMEGIKG